MVKLLFYVKLDYGKPICGGDENFDFSRLVVKSGRFDCEELLNVGSQIKGFSIWFKDVRTSNLYP